MRYEVIRLVQFLFSLGLIAAAFAGGIGVGWWRWGRVRRATAAVSGATPDVAPPAPSRVHAAGHDGTAARQDLFAPEIDLSAQPARAGARGWSGAPTGIAPVAELPRITAPAATPAGRERTTAGRE